MRPITLQSVLTSRLSLPSPSGVSFIDIVAFTAPPTRLSAASTSSAAVRFASSFSTIEISLASARPIGPTLIFTTAL